MDINRELFRIVNNLIILENYLDYEFKYNYKRLNFLINKRNFYTNIIINKHFLPIQFNYFNLNKEIQKSNLIYNNKVFLNNEKKIMKNNKNIYMNKFIIKKKKIIKKNKIDKRKRNSKYRGVSKNGNGWQVLIMYNKNKSYIGTYNSEELAARIYDIVAIKRIGIKAKTNFIYNNEQISKILKSTVDFKSPNISKLILELIN